jgi:hypothetical protein
MTSSDNINPENRKHVEPKNTQEVTDLKLHIVDLEYKLKIANDVIMNLNKRIQYM